MRERESYFKFYPREWQAGTRCLSPLARSVWLEMIIVMREAQPKGFFVGHSGEAIDLRDFANDYNFKPADVRKAIAEIQDKNVCSTDSFGRIYCRFILYENARSQTNRENGLLGGNPDLVSDKQSVKRIGVTESDNQPDNQGGKPQRHRQRSDTDSLRSSALDFGEWPTENERLRSLAMLFLGAFGNCFDPVKAEKHLPDYTATLAQMRSRGVSIEQSWQAFSDARFAFGKPLFGARAKMAMSFLPARPSRLNAPVLADVEGL